MSECADGASESTLNSIPVALYIDTIVRSNRTGPGQREKRGLARLMLMLLQEMLNYSDFICNMEDVWQWQNHMRLH